MKRFLFGLFLIVALFVALSKWQDQQTSKTASISMAAINRLVATVQPGRQVQSSQSNQSNSSDVEGPPTISAALINQVLAAGSSPAEGTGQALYDLGVQYGIDPAYALAFFQHESTLGTAGVARATLSLGNIKCSSGYTCIEGFRAYQSWQAGFEDWYRLIKTLYIGQWGLRTVEQIIPVYAPASDHNDVAGYIAAILTAVRTWRNEVQS